MSTSTHNSKTHASWLRSSVGKLAIIHFVFVFAYMAQIMVYDAWKLIPPEAVMRRWIAASGLLIVSAFVWYMARSKAATTATYKKLVFGLILADIAMASFNVYTQRGMASRAVALYAIPIIVSGVLMSRVAIFTTSLLCIAAYTSTAVSYFVLNFNEGYKIELYGEVVSYCVMFIILSSLLWVLVRHRQQN